MRMKKKRILLIIIIIALMIILVGIGFVLLNKSSSSPLPNTQNGTEEPVMDFSFKTNKDATSNVTTDSNGLLVNNSTKFSEKHSFESYTINDFELVQDKDNKNLVHAKFKVSGKSPYKVTGISFTFTFSDGTKSETYTTFVDSLDESIDYTILNKVIDSVDYEFTVFEFSGEADG